jgi:hypothetical protein
MQNTHTHTHTRTHTHFWRDLQRIYSPSLGYECYASRHIGFMNCQISDIYTASLRKSGSWAETNKFKRHETRKCWEFIVGKRKKSKRLKNGKGELRGVQIRNTGCSWRKNFKSILKTILDAGKPCSMQIWNLNLKWFVSKFNIHGSVHRRLLSRNKNKM